MSPEYTASDADCINSPPSDAMQEYEELELTQSRLTPPPPYPGTANSYHTDLNTYGSGYQDYGVYGHSSIVSGSGGHASIDGHSHPQQPGDGPCYQDLVTVPWTQSGQDWTSSFRQSTNTLEEFDLSFLTGDNLQESQSYYDQGPAS